MTPQQLWRKNNPEKSRGYSKSWRERNPEHSKIAHIKRMLDFKGRALSLIKAARRRSKQKNLEFNLTLKDVLPQIEKGICQLTELPFDLIPPGRKKRNPYSPSIDRIDSSKGYTPDNIRIVLVAVNDCINQYGDDTILPILKALVKGIEKNNVKKTKPA